MALLVQPGRRRLRGAAGALRRGERDPGGRSGCNHRAVAQRAPARRIDLNAGGGNFKAQFRRADNSGALLAVIVGEDELARGVVGVKPLRAQAGQSECPIAELASGVDQALAALRPGGVAPV